MKKRVLALLMLLLFAFTFSASAAVIEPDDLFYVYDGANVLSDGTIATIVRNNDALYDACGAQIVIVTLDTTGRTDISDYAYTLFNQWGIGSAEKNNGVLILMEIGAEDYYYIQGAGLEKKFSTDELAKLVDRYLEPDFAIADYDSGALKLFEQIFNKLNKLYSAGCTYRLYTELGGTSNAGSNGAVIPSKTREPLGNAGTTYFPETTPKKENDGFSVFLGLIVFILMISFIGGILRRITYHMRGMSVPMGMGFWLFRPWRVFRPRHHYYNHGPHYGGPGPGPRPGGPHPGGPRPGGFGGAPHSSNYGGGRASSFGGSRSSGFSSGRSSSFGSSRSSGFSSGRSSSFGSSRSSGFSNGRSSSFGGSRSSGGFSRSGGGGSTRGGGGGRGR